MIFFYAYLGTVVVAIAAALFLSYLELKDKRKSNKFFKSHKMKNFITWFKSLFSKAQRLLNKLIPIAVKIVQGVKKAINNGTLELITDVLEAVLPTAGDLVVEAVEKYLTERIPALCLELEIIQAVNLSDKTEEAIAQALAALKETYGDKWSTFMSTLAGDLSNFLSDGVIDPKEGKEIAAKFYDEYIKNTA